MGNQCAYSPPSQCPGCLLGKSIISQGPGKGEVGIVADLRLLKEVSARITTRHSPSPSYVLDLLKPRLVSSPGEQKKSKARR